MLAPADPPPLPAAIAFGPFALDFAGGVLLRDGVPVPLPARELAVLRYLVVRAGRAVAVDELLSAIWPDTCVDRGVVKVMMLRLRKALEAGGAGPWIETRSRAGYAFVAPTCWRPAPLGIEPGGLAPVEMVGRDPEVRRLSRALAEAASGRRRAVWIHGEVGIGKTTLLRAFLHGPAAEAAAWVLIGHASDAFGAGEPHHALLEALERVAASSAGPDLLPLLRHHAPTWWRGLPLALRGGGEVGAPRSASRESMLRELARALEAASALRPLVLAIEDVQWADAATLEALLHLLRRPEPTRLLVLATCRSRAVDAARRPLFAELLAATTTLACCETLALGRLNRSDVPSFIEARLPGAACAPALADVLHGRSEGNPLFLASLVDLAAEHGLVAPGSNPSARHLAAFAQSLPPRVRDAVEHRVEARAPAERAILEAVSAAGISTSTASIAAALDVSIETVERSCDSLVCGDVLGLARAGRESWPDGTTSHAYRFAHPLPREVVYANLPAARRAALHLKIGSRLEQGYGARAGEIAPLLAHHFDCAGAPQRALHYHECAAQAAMRSHAYREAAGHLGRVLEILPRLANDPEARQRELHALLLLAVARTATEGYAAAAVEAAWDRARWLCDERGDEPGLDLVHWGLWGYHATRGDILRAERDADTLRERAERAGSGPLLLPALVAVANTAFHRGDLSRAIALHARAEALHRHDVHGPLAALYGVDVGAVAAAYAAVALTVAGAVPRARARLADALALAESSSLPLGLAFAQHMAASVHLHLGEVSEGERHAAELERTARAHGLRHWLALAGVAAGWALLLRGCAGPALARIRQGAERYAETGARLSYPYVAARLAEALMASGSPGEALSVVDAGLADAAAREERWYDAELWRIRAEAAGRSGDRAGEQASLRRALAIAASQCAAGFGLAAALALAGRLAADDPNDEARDVLMRAIEATAEPQAHPLGRRVLALLETLRRSPPAAVGLANGASAAQPQRVARGRDGC